MSLWQIFITGWTGIYDNISVSVCQRVRLRTCCLTLVIDDDVEQPPEELGDPSTDIGHTFGAATSRNEANDALQVPACVLSLTSRTRQGPPWVTLQGTKGCEIKNSTTFWSGRSIPVANGRWNDSRQGSVKSHDDVIKWKHFPRYWLFVRRIHRSSVNCPDKG